MAQIIESDLNRAIAAGECRIEIDPQAGDESLLDRASGERGHGLQAPLRRAEVAGQKFTLRTVQLELEGKLVALLPAVVRQQFPAGDQIGKRYSVCCGRLGALSCDQVERGQLFPLLPRGDQDCAAVELIDYVEDALLAFLAASVQKEQSSDSKMLFGARFFRNKRVSGFVDSVVFESVGVVAMLDELLAHRLPEIALNLLLRCALNERERGR